VHPDDRIGALAVTKMLRKAAEVARIEGLESTNFSKIKNGWEIPVKNWETEKLA
jgi:hypothetical protein